MTIGLLFFYLCADWPANSPDLNPMENVCGVVKRMTRDTRPNNADELKAAIEATWAFTTPQELGIQMKCVDLQKKMVGWGGQCLIQVINDVY